MNASSRSLHDQLLDGFVVHARPDGTVYTVKNAKGETVAEVCVGKETTRLNFREPFTEAVPVLGGRSQTWRGGGMKVTAANLAQGRELLERVTGTAAPTRPDHSSQMSTDEEMRAYLDSVFGTAAFRIHVGVIELDVPEEFGEPKRDFFTPPASWQVHQRAGDEIRHAVGLGEATSLCGIAVDGPNTDAVTDPDSVSCHGCRFRLIAIEMAALPSLPIEPAEHVRLHEEMARILRDSGNEWMTTAQLADAVNASGRYQRKDRGDITPFQVHGRSRNYPKLFERDGSRVRLWEGEAEDADIPAGFEELTARMDALAGELDLSVVLTRTGKNYRPKQSEEGASATSGVGVYTSTKGVEFNLQVFRDLGEDATADDLFDRIRRVSGEPVFGGKWPAVSCASLAHDWDLTRLDVMEPYFHARAQHFGI